MDPAAARALYNELTQLDEFDRSMQIPLEVPARDQLIARVVEALRDCSSHEGGRILFAPSPWHAFFLLWDRMACARRRGSAAFFRGHNTTALTSVTASIYRAGLTQHEVDQARVSVDILEYLFKRSEILRMKSDDPRLLARTVAQHYGIRTSLIDVTLDPAVAVFFALFGGGEAERSAFVFDWELCQVLELDVQLPPMSPWARRLTVQRGFFLDLETLRSLDNVWVPHEVRFPSMEGFEVRRGGACYVPWPVDEPAATKLLAWVRDAAATHRMLSAAVIEEIDARGATRVLLNHQFELMFGFAPDGALPSQDRNERLQGALRAYMLESIAQLEVYVNHLCLQRGLFSAERVRALQTTNKSLFEICADQLCRLRRSGGLRDPQYDELLRILAHECSEADAQAGA
jgi:hypothetical protein